MFLLLLIFTPDQVNADELAGYVECNDSTPSPMCLNLSRLVNEIDDKSNAHQNYIDMRNLIHRPHDGSWGNAHCKLMQKIDCDDHFGFTPITDFAREAFGVSFFNSTSMRPSIEQNQSVLRTMDEETKCLCIESTLAVKLEENGGDLEVIVDARIKDIQENVLKSFGKKVINDYAHIYEDGMFFLNHTNVINPQKTDALLCRGASHLTQKIGEKCPNKKKAQIDKRLELIFSEMDFNGAKTIEEKLQYVDYNTIHRKAKDSKGNEVTYLRSEYDKTRYGLKQTQEFKVLDRMLTNLFSSNEFQDERSYGPGFEVISTKISELLFKDFDGTITKIFNNQVPQKFLDEWKTVRSMPNAKQEFEDRFTRYLLKVAPSHPGLSTILLDSDMFSKFKSHSQTKKISSVFSELENNFSEMEKYMEARCQKMADDFADVVCLEEEDILNSLSKDSLKSFSQSEDGDILGINDVVMCRGGQYSNMSFQGLNKDGSKIVNSDLFMFLNDKNNSADPYSSFAHDLANNEKKRELISYAALASNSNTPRRSSYDPLKNHFDKFKKDKLIDSNGAIAEVNITYDRGVVRDSSVDRSIASIPSIAQASVTASTTAQVLPRFSSTVGQADLNNKVDTKELSDMFSSREDKDEINSHLSKLHSKELKELQDFRRNVLSEKEEALKMQLDEEKKNLEKLKATIDNLTSSKNEIKENVPAKKGNNKVVETNTSPSSRVVNHEVRDIPSVNRVAASNENRAHFAPSAGTGAASISSGGLSQSAASSRSTSNAGTSKAGVANNNEAATANRRGLVVQESSAIISNNQEITKNIVEYLKTVDSETFLRFTKEGVVYKYKTVENGVLVDKEVHVSVNDVDPQALAEIVKVSEMKLDEVQRKYSYESLKIIISEEALKLL
ncbi:MAG TPA: hypothetical protein VKZ84_01870 [Bacteriovoracaceae bacterium]|nr:hypothetical protein [Bacteriovoracaceae bacterium]